MQISDLYNLALQLEFLFCERQWMGTTYGGKLRFSFEPQNKCCAV